MKAIILAAGYATRLYPITQNFPKPLLTVARKEILTHLIEKIEDIEAVDEVFVITNHKFYKYFEVWSKAIETNLKVHIIDDQTTSNEDKLGAIGDLSYAINRMQIDDDVLVMAGDTLFNFSLRDFVQFFFDKKTPVIAAFDMKDKNIIRKRYGCIEFDENKKIISFEEKPEDPKSSISATPFYIYPKNFLAKIYDYIFDGNNPDAPGNLIKWICTKMSCHAYLLEEDRYDIGTLESYNKINELFEEKIKDGDLK